jgi:hypothetical protein
MADDLEQQRVPDAAADSDDAPTTGHDPRYIT